jgi:G3E family GTPase
MTLIPLAIVTGFLGSGKTTLIRHLLTQPGLAQTLVIVNEFGEVGIDHLLLEASSDDTILLANGCLCCTIRGNLVDTLVDVWEQREEGRIGAFDRVVVETSGVADPAPLLAFLLGDMQVTARYRIDALVATCDLANGEATLARQPEARNQLRLADRILLTKRDLAPPEQVGRMTALARELNPEAAIVAVERGEADADMVLAPMTRSRAEGSSHSVCAVHDGHEHAHHHHAYADDAHTHRFACVTFTAWRALSREDVGSLTRLLRQHAGPALLRVKGVLPVDFDERMLVVQGALMIVHEPYFLAGPGSAGRLVVISQGPVPADLVSNLANFGLHVEG